MNVQTPHAKALLECPESSTHCEVTFEVHVFSGANKGGLEVTRCSEAACDGTRSTCMHNCVHTSKSFDCISKNFKNIRLNSV